MHRYRIRGSGVVSHSRVVPGLGITTPFFVPPLAALLRGLALSTPLGPATMADPIIACTSGTLGVLIGVDLLNLDRIRDMAASMVSMGGAGTFDGISLAGVTAAFFAWRQEEQPGRM